MNISFSMTTAQVERGFATGVIEKDVTRRNGWLKLTAGQVLNACEKCQGIKKGESVRVLGKIRVLSVRRERLAAMTNTLKYGIEETKREGFGDHPTLRWPSEFVKFFCAGHKGVTPETVITRIEFEYL
jgi:hypothetical protein